MIQKIKDFFETRRTTQQVIKEVKRDGVSVALQDFAFKYNPSIMEGSLLKLRKLGFKIQRADNPVIKHWIVSA